MDLPIPKAGDIWQHYKGAYYKIINLGRDENGFVVVIYTSRNKDELYTCRLDRWLQTLDDHSPRYARRGRELRHEWGPRTGPDGEELDSMTGEDRR